MDTNNPMTTMYEIMPCGMKAKECNPLGKKPTISEFDHYDHIEGGNVLDAEGWENYDTAIKQWEREERNRKEYEIDVKESVCYCFDCPFPCDKHKPGSIHPGIIVNNHKIKIV